VDFWIGVFVGFGLILALTWIGAIFVRGAQDDGWRESQDRPILPDGKDGWFM
jgi:hypothetical protein